MAKNIMVHPEKVIATLMYPDTEKKLFLTFEGKGGKTEYCIVIKNDEAKRLQAKLKVLFGDNEYGVEPIKIGLDKNE